MQELKNEQTELKTQTVSTEEKEGDRENAVSLGKFKDVNSLLTAYNSLQAEFTKRCQRIKELEGITAIVDKESTPTADETVEGVAPKGTEGITRQDKEDILKDYLKDILSTKQEAIILDRAGLGIKTPARRPKSIWEAGQLAQELLDQSK